MVATRRGARTGHTEEPEEQDASLTLRKKPIRRATAASTAKAAATAKAASTGPKTRATRSRKPEPEREEDAAQPEHIDESPEEPKPITTRATRSKRAETVEPEPMRATRTTKTTTQPKRTVSARKVEVAQDTQQAPATSAKPALAARSTRQTRAKTPVSQAPLSPKKITQVSRVRTRGAKPSSDAKPKPAQSTRAASATQPSRTLRKRTVSDENAEVPDLRPAKPSEDAVAEVIEEASTKVTSPRKSSPVKEQEPHEEEQLSSGETTPASSPGHVFEQPKDYTEDNIDADDLEETDDEPEAAADSASDDELCGPKTPMKRTNSARSRYYTSVRKDAARVNAEVPMHTPPRRYGPRGATRSTPQTQRPYGQAAISDSVARPMTVARADSRPFVFRKLREDVESTPKPIVSKDGGDSGSGNEEEIDDDMEAQTDEHDPLNPTDEGIDTEMANSEDAHSHKLEDEEDDTPAGRQADPDETIIVDEGEAEDDDESELAESPTVQPPVASYDVDDSMADVDSSVIEPPVAEYEPEDSILDSPAAEPPVASCELDLDGSIIIHSRDGSDSEECSDDEDDEQGGITEFGLKTPRPETIPWQNIREDNTIPVDFDMHFADVRSPARDEVGIYNGPVSDFTNFANMELDQINGTQGMDEDAEGGAPDPTMNMNDFIDMAALAEPTLRFDTASGATQDESPNDVDDDTENTVIITRPKTLSSSPARSAHGDEEAFKISTPTGPSQSRSPLASSQQAIPLKSAMESEIAVPHQTSADVLEFVDDNVVPHYALPTMSSRRKSLPALGNQTPVRCSSRPITSDGASIARVARPFDNAWMSRSRRSSIVGASTSATPIRSTFARSMSSGRKTPRAADAISSSPLLNKTPGVNFDARPPHHTPKHGNVKGRDQAQTIAAPSRFHTPGRSPVRRPATVQKLASQPQRPMSTSSHMAETPARNDIGSSTDGSEQTNEMVVPLRFRTPTSSDAQKSATAQRPDSCEIGADVNHESAPIATPQERFPRRSARQTYTEHASTIAAPARFHTPIQGKPRRPATAQKLASQGTVSKASQSQKATPGQTPRGPSSQATPQAATPSAATPLQRFPKLPSKDAYDEHAEAASVPLPATPQARFPRRPPQQTYDERANTVIAPSRYRSPAQASPRRPATSQKPVNLRKAAMKSSVPTGSLTPIKTPLKAPAMTPSQVPMTPHPGAPLRGVLALVEVFTLDGASASAPFVSLLQRLGAKTTKSWSDRVTHVIFKDGSPTTLQRVRLNNKEVESTGKGFTVHCVNSRWVSDCDASGSRVDEDDDAYAVDVTEVPRGGSRRRKSMEPSALVNIGGNIVRDRKSSGRYSIGRSSRVTSAEKKPEEEVPFTPGITRFDGLQDENDFDEGSSELATPDYLAAPDKLVQMTAPMNRVRKLDLKKDEAKNRRMTSFWEGGE